MKVPKFTSSSIVLGCAALYYDDARTREYADIDAAARRSSDSRNSYDRDDLDATLGFRSAAGTFRSYAVDRH